MSRSLPIKATQRVMSVGAAWSVLGLFALALALLGGSSRTDVVQIVALRPIAALMLIPAFYLISKEAVREVRTPLMLFAAFVLWMLIQLVPLPPSVWQSLPDRDALAALDALALSQDVWRPISMVPARGINAAASLMVLVAAIALPLALRTSARNIFLLIVVIGIADAGLGFLQVMTGARGPLYFYEITNFGAAVGVFANENHSAVFSSCIMLVAARLFLSSSWKNEGPWIKVISAAAFVLSLLAVVISGSRAGLFTGLLALGASVVIAYLSASPPKKSGRNSPRGKPHRGQQKAKPGVLNALASRAIADPRKIVIIGATALIAVAALFVLNGRAAGVEAAINKDPFDDLRWGLLPVLRSMASIHWLFGTGFGSFEEVYHLYEPTELMRSTYINQAHNDWAQIVIEGGVPAIIILACLLAWIVKSVVVILRTHDKGKAAALFWAAIFAVVAAASLPDYPLRSPMFQTFCVWLILALAKEAGAPQAVARPR